MPGLTAEQILQQKRNARAAGGGGTDGGGDQSAAAPTPQAAAPQMPPRTQTPGTAYGDKWQDFFPGTSGYGKPARPGQQSWFDWFSKSYNQDPTDAAKVAADAAVFHTTPRIVQGMQYLHNTPLGTAMPIPQGWTPQATQQGVQDAYNRLGPGSIIPQAAGYALGTAALGVGPIGKGLGMIGDALLPSAPTIAKAIMPAAAKYVPEKLIPTMIEGGNTAGAIGAGKTYGGGGTPEEALMSYAKNMAVGAPLAGAISALPLGARTPADVTNLTQQGLKTGDVTIPRKNLGFTVESGPGQFADNPTLAQIEDLRRSLQTLHPKAYTAPTPSATATAPAGYRSQYDTQLGPEDPGYQGTLPKPAADRDATVGNPALQQDVRTPNQKGGTIQDILLQKIANALPQTLDQKYLTAMDQANQAVNLQRMRDNVGLPGYDPRPQAADLSQTYDPGTPQNVAYQKIARVPESSDVVTPKGRTAMVGGFGGLGEALNYLTGLRGFATGGGFVGDQGANLLNYLGNRGTGEAGLKQMIDQQYPALTGWSVGGGGNQAINDMMLRMYGAGQPGPYGNGPGYPPSQ